MDNNLTNEQKQLLIAKVEQLDNIIAQKEELEKLEKKLKSEITEELNKNDLTEFKVSDSLKVKLVKKTTYKYIDELGMINWLEQNGYEQFIEKTIKKPSLNKELNKGWLLTESLNKMYTKNVSTSFMLEHK